MEKKKCIHVIYQYVLHYFMKKKITRNLYYSKSIGKYISNFFLYYSKSIGKYTLRVRTLPPKNASYELM